MSSIIQKYKKLRSELDKTKRELVMSNIILSEYTKDIAGKKTRLNALYQLEWNTGKEMSEQIIQLQGLIHLKKSAIKTLSERCYKLKRRIKVISSQMSNLIK